MRIYFHKYHGTGNDFLLLDNRNGAIRLTGAQIAFLCHRHFGVGADGLMLLQEEGGFDFRMVYYNSDGRESTMCGNGGRCIAAFASALGIIASEARFMAIDGVHTASIDATGPVSLRMKDVDTIQRYGDHAVLDTGSPHYVQWTERVKYTDVFSEGRAIRNREEFQPDGINVNFTERLEAGLWVRTYERGVEDETLSCGTGVVAAAIAASGADTGDFRFGVDTLGGHLGISFKKDSPSSAKEVFLHGPAVFVFEGTIDI